MGLKSGQPAVQGGGIQSVIRKTDPAKYSSLGDFIDEVNRPDIREALIKTYGNQGITGFLQLVGAVKASGTADKVQYWEEARLHARQKGAWATATTFDITTKTASPAGTDVLLVRENDVILHGKDRYIVKDVPAIASGVYTITVEGLGTVTAPSAGDALDAPIIGNLYAQGGSQPNEYMESNVVLRENPYMILKETFKVTGSQATNIGYINLGNGDYRWYIKGEMDTRQRFLDKREMMMLLGVNDSVTVNGKTVQGSEGYFAAIENRGIVETGGTVSTIGELDAIITELDKQGAAPEYAIYGNTQQCLDIDDMVASLNGAAGFSTTSTGVAAFGGGSAPDLGYDQFSRGGYTFFKKSWKLLNDPTLLGSSAFKGVMIPLTSVVDPKSGERAAALEMNYKATNGYSREMEHWMTGSILGVANNNEDSLQFNYRSECNLVTRAANQHVLIRS